MPNLIKSILTNKGSAILILGTFIGSFFNYLYALVMGRMLGPDNYGTFIALLSLLMIATFLFNVFQTVSTKYISELFAKEKFSTIKIMVFNMAKHSLLIGAGISVVFLLTSSLLTTFFKVSSVYPILILATLPVAMAVLPMARSLLQGFHLFGHLGVNIVGEAITRFVSGVVLVYLGFSVAGAIGASTIAVIVAVVLCIFPVEGFLKTKNGKDITEKISWRTIYGFTIPVAVTQLCMTIIPFIDVVFVKKFFSSYDTGVYAGAATIGKIIYFLPAPLTFLIIPKGAYLSAKGKSVMSMLLKSLVITGIMCVVLSIGYFLFPEFIILSLFNEKYISAKPLLKFFSISMSLFSITNILVYFQLSLGRKKFTVVLFAITCLQIILLFMYHNSLYQILYVLITCGALLVITNTIFSFIAAKNMIK